MKTVFFILAILAGLLPFSIQTNAQPTQLWATYYGDFDSTINIFPHPIGYNPVPYYGKTYITDIALDSINGFIYVVGSTTDSAGIATPGAFQENYEGRNFMNTPFDEPNGFLAKFDTLGNRLWGTYFGGAGPTFISQLVLDTSGNIYFTGYTASTSGIATPNGFITQLLNEDVMPPADCAFLEKFDANGQQLWGTYYGGDSIENGNLHYPPRIAYDVSSDNIYLVGRTSSEVLPFWYATPGSFQDTIPFIYDTNGNHYRTVAGYIARFDEQGQRVWGTYYGGANLVTMTDVWVDPLGNVYCLGEMTYRDTLPNAINYLTTPNSDQPGMLDTSTAFLVNNGFLVKFNNQGERQWGTYVGNKALLVQLRGRPIAPGSSQVELYIAGYATEPYGNATSSAYQPMPAGGWDYLIFKYDEQGVKQWSTFYGGIGNEHNLGDRIFQGNALTILPNGNFLLLGKNRNTDILEDACHPWPHQYDSSFVSEWSPAGVPQWMAYLDPNYLTIRSAGKGNLFYMGGLTDIDRLASDSAHQITKVLGKNSGFFGAFTTEKYCPPVNMTIHRDGNNNFSVGDSFAVYQWYDENGLIAGANGFSYTPDSTVDSLYVQVSDVCDCHYWSDTVDVHAPVGVAPITDNNYELKVYPNPNQGQLWVSGRLSQSVDDVRLNITDVLGRRIYSETFSAAGNTTFSKEIDITGFSAGVYQLQLVSSLGATTIKFVKN